MCGGVKVVRVCVDGEVKLCSVIVATQVICLCLKAAGSHAGESALGARSAGTGEREHV